MSTSICKSTNPAPTPFIAFHNLPMHITKTQCKVKMAQDVGMLWKYCQWCHFHFVWLVFEGSITKCAYFHSENCFCDFCIVKWCNFQLKFMHIMAPLVVRSVIAIAMDWDVFMPLCSFQRSDLTATGTMALARALQHNKSLEELMWVVNWVTRFIMLFLVAIRNVRVEQYLHRWTLI